MRAGKTSSFPPSFMGEVTRRTGRLIAALLLGALVMMTSAVAGWREQATPADLKRFDEIDEARAKAINEVGRAVTPHDLSIIDSIVHAPVVPAKGSALAGEWRCRTIELGGATAHVIYGWFRCRIGAKDGVLTLDKLTGSQRMQGTLYPQGDAFVYLGASGAKGHRPPRYSGNGGASADQIGLFTALADGRARLELPYPMQQSTFDVLELKR